VDRLIDSVFYFLSVAYSALRFVYRLSAPSYAELISPLESIH